LRLRNPTWIFIAASLVKNLGGDGEIWSGVILFSSKQNFHDPASAAIAVATGFAPPAFKSLRLHEKHSHKMILILFLVLRRRRDLNSRDPFEPATFPRWWNKPLSDVSNYWGSLVIRPLLAFSGCSEISTFLPPHESHPRFRQLNHSFLLPPR
jgi:hypothetical protein